MSKFLAKKDQAQLNKPEPDTRKLKSKVREMRPVQPTHDPSASWASKLGFTTKSNGTQCS